MNLNQRNTGPENLNLHRFYCGGQKETAKPNHKSTLKYEGKLDLVEISIQETMQ